MRAVVFCMIISASLILVSNVTFDEANASFRESRSSITTNQLNSYSNYVHFQPEWNSYPKNLIVEVSTSWERELVPGQEKLSDITKSGAKQKQNTLQYVNSKPVVSVQYDYRDCETQWIHYARIGLNFLGDRLEMLEPKSIKNLVYSDEEQTQKLQEGFATFVPICTSKDTTNYEYTISINDKTIGYDVYFVPSFIQQWNYFLYPQYFEHYSQKNCYGHNYQKFSGICNQVDRNGGLLIIIPDELSRPMTKISVEMTEIPDSIDNKQEDEEIRDS